MSKTTKLRRVGNSTGLTFSKETLERAGFKDEEKVEVLVADGEICIRPTSGRYRLDLTAQEVKAMVTGTFDTKAGQSLVAKARKLMKGEK